jgi:hypothetical protein
MKNQTKDISTLELPLSGLTKKGDKRIRTCQHQYVNKTRLFYAISVIYTFIDNYIIQLEPKCVLS